MRPKSAVTLRVRTGLRCSPKRARRVPTPGIPDHFGYGRPRVPRSGPLLASAPGPPGVRFGAVCARRRHHMHVASRRRSRRGISFRMRPFTAQYTPSRCRGGGPLRPAWAPEAPESPRHRPVSRSSPRVARRLSTCRSIYGPAPAVRARASASAFPAPLSAATIIDELTPPAQPRQKHELPPQPFVSATGAIVGLSPV